MAAISLLGNIPFIDQWLTLRLLEIAVGYNVHAEMEEHISNTLRCLR